MPQVRPVTYVFGLDNLLDGGAAILVYQRLRSPDSTGLS